MADGRSTACEFLLLVRRDADARVAHTDVQADRFARLAFHIDAHAPVWADDLKITSKTGAVAQGVDYILMNSLAVVRMNTIQKEFVRRDVVLR